MSGRHVSLSPWMARYCAIALISVFWGAAGHAQTATESTPPSASAPTMGPMNKDQLEMAARFEECRRKLQDERSGGLITSLRLGASAVEIDVDRERWKPMPFDSQLAIVQHTARLLPVEKRDVFLQRIGAVLARKRDFQDDDVADAVELALCGLLQRQAVE